MGNEVRERINEVRTNYTRTRQKMKLDVEEKRYPLQSEPALIHPKKSSVVKLRDNGTIDVFVGTDNGLRIDPEQKSITALSNVYKGKHQYEWTHAERNKTQNVGNDFVTNVGNDEVHNVAKGWTIHAGKHANIISDGSIYMEAREKLHMRAPHIHLDATAPKDELDSVRPPLGLMFEEDAPYGLAVPFGYRVHIGAQPEEKKPRYRREEYDDLHVDLYETVASLRGKDKVRKDNDGEWQGPLLRKKYEFGRIEMTAGKFIDMTTFEKDGAIDINASGSKSDITVNATRTVNINAGSKVNITPFPEHAHPEYEKGASK